MKFKKEKLLGTTQQVPQRMNPVRVSSECFILSERGFLSLFIMYKSVPIDFMKVPNFWP
uniref:Uncharacterized protein n=1 Tax=Arion vulgaris TaxID=1028688 RepID=A0A0B6Y9K2_9EUPU